MDDRFSDETKFPHPFVKYHRVKIQNDAPFLSRQAPGTPLAWETLFQMIRDNKTDSVPFRWMRRVLNMHTDEFIWDAYAHWVEKKVHPNIACITNNT